VISAFNKVFHPTNRIWPGSPDRAMFTIEEAYIDGYTCGREWSNDWKHIPGGPIVYVSGKDGFTALEDHQRRVHKEWMRGWHDGFQQAHIGNLPSWYR
jgi:hypothetical protein